MGRSQESMHKKAVRDRKEKKRKEKEKKKQERKENPKKNNPDDMIAYVDEYGNISNTPPDPKNKEKTKLEDIEISPTKSSYDKTNPIRQGIVEFFNEDKGYGFIKDSQNKQSVFVHVNNLLDDIREGNEVSFEIEKGEKGPVAVRVKKS